MKHAPRLSSASLTAAWSPLRTAHRRLWRTAALQLGELDRNERSALSEIVVQYALDHQLEQGAQRPADVDLLLAEWRSIAQRISALTDGARDEAKHRADEILAKAGVPVAALSELAGQIMFAARVDQPDESDGSSNDGYFKPGAAWDRFVFKLVDFYEAKCGTAATVNKSARDGFSPTAFVKFVHTVQTFLPWQYWQHPVHVAETKTINALGTELNSAVAKVLSARRAGLRTPHIAA